MDKAILVNIVLIIHMALTGIMLFRLFKLKSATGGQLFLTFIGLMVPVIGPSILISYYNKLIKKQQKEIQKPSPSIRKSKKSTKK